MSLLLQEKEITPNFYFMFLLSLSVKYLNFVALHGDRESVYYFSSMFQEKHLPFIERDRTVVYA